MHKSKRKGNTLEQQVAKDLREQYPFVKTTRETSKLLDDSKIDLSGLPFLVQCKAGYNKVKPKYEKLYVEMKALITQNYPQNHLIHRVPYVLIHKMNGTKGKKEPELFQVTMTYELFLELIKNYNPGDIIQ